jgi:hypothetical protein
MHYQPAGAILALALSAAAFAATPQEPAKPAALTPSARFEALKKAQADAEAEFQKLYEAAKGEAEQEKVFNEKYPKPEQFVPRAIAIVKDAPKDPVAVDVMIWTAQLGPIKGDDAAPLYDAVLTNHLADPKIVAACRALQFQAGSASENFQRRVFKESKDKDARGTAGYLLAKRMQSRASYARQLQSPGNAEMAAQFEQYFGADWVAETKKADAAAIEKDAEAMLERIISEYADVADVAATRGKLGDAASRDLFEIRSLAVGKPAPEIEGEDVDGVKFKLSYYRGKVLFLDFWGFW